MICEDNIWGVLKRAIPASMWLIKKIDSSSFEYINYNIRLWKRRAALLDMQCNVRVS